MNLQFSESSETLVEADEHRLVIDCLGCNQRIGNVVAYKFKLGNKIQEALPSCWACRNYVGRPGYALEKCQRI